MVNHQNPMREWKRVSHLFPTWWANPQKKHLKPVCLAIARLRRTESTALAMKESHLFPTWWANPQKTPETSVFGNSAASTYWKHSSCNAMKESHLFPTWWANPQKSSETSVFGVFGNSAASTYWKHSSCNERESPLPNMMSQPTKNLWNRCVWQ